jgi:hypothetical protein
VSKTAVLIATLVCGSLWAQSALAADQKQCADQFKAADLNNDGVIARSEMGSSPNMIPASLSNKSRISRKEYMAACTKAAAKNKGCSTAKTAQPVITQGAGYPGDRGEVRDKEAKKRCFDRSKSTPLRSLA